MIAIVVLGMHRSGTSCLAGMLAAAGLASAGEVVRNWDNARGHHEMLDAIRLDEAVLAHSGGHWLSPPATVRWTDAHAEARDQLLRARIDGRPALIKDPRALLVLPFWRASSVAFRAVGIVRHPLAAARSLEAWRETPLASGIALWLAHNRVLEADRARHHYALVDFDAPAREMIDAVRAAFPDAGEAALAAAYEAQLVHHDADDAPEVPGLDDARALHARLLEPSRTPRRTAFPRAELAAFAQRLAARDLHSALAHARAAIALVADAAAVIVPIVTSLVRAHAVVEAEVVIAEHASRLDAGLAELLRGKVLLAAGDAATAVRHLEAACARPSPYFQARQLLPQALRGVGRHAEARAALAGLAREALYPHGPLSTLAEWSWLDGERSVALEEMQHAIDAAPLRRRGRLRARRAQWLNQQGDQHAARAELLQAIDEDPGYLRTRELLARMC
ncbi:MAG: hypothetical protein H0V17_00285 [Deltaproteobacteria bacterium]|nr:hypothetical protein [Deltaproteobacteria bacterium]